MEAKENVTYAIDGTLALMEKSTRQEYLNLHANELAKLCKQYLGSTTTVNQAKFSQYYSALFIKAFRKMPNLFYQWKSVLADDIVYQFNTSLMRCIETWDESKAAFTTLLFGDFRYGMCGQQRLADMQKRRAFDNYISFGRGAEGTDGNGYITDIGDEREHHSLFEIDIDSDKRFTDKEKQVLILLGRGYKKYAVREALGIGRHEFGKIIDKIIYIYKGGQYAKD